MKFTDTQLDNMIHHLRVAASRYDDDAVFMFEAKQPHLAAQFQRQAQEARVIADLIENREDA